MKKTIVFDLGGVLIEWDRRALFKKLFNDVNELDYFLTEVFSLEWKYGPVWNSSTFSQINSGWFING